MGKQYHIKLNGELIPVTEEVYRAYQQPKWREKKQAEVRAQKEVSLDAMLETGYSGHLDSRQALVDEIVADKLLLDELLKALAELNEDERFLIDELFYKEKTEREIADSSNISHQAVHKKKNRILAKLEKLLKS
ncbi:MAG: sigma factor-like helix-turn-helix DNA-binding protein [Saccharofermentanales bacterium]|jgi:RNA polymerase sigma factor (sigma-70 family)